MFVLGVLPADAARIKDISDIYGIRDNNLFGYGLRWDLSAQ